MQLRGQLPPPKIKEHGAPKAYDQCWLLSPLKLLKSEDSTKFLVQTLTDTPFQSTVWCICTFLWAFDGVLVLV